MRWWMLVAAGCGLVLGGALWFAASEPEPVRLSLPEAAGPAPTFVAPIAAPVAPPSAVPRKATEPVVAAPVVVAPPPAPLPPTGSVAAVAPAPIVLPAATGGAAPGGAIADGVAELPAADEDEPVEAAPPMKALPSANTAALRQRTGDVASRLRQREAAAQVRAATIQR